MLEHVQRGALRAIDVVTFARLLEAEHDPADVRPATVAELATLVGRAEPIIRRALGRLERIGLIRMAPPTLGGQGGVA
jgi:predicted transcriptional regulator